MFWKTAAWLWNRDDQDSGTWLDDDVWKTPDRTKTNTSGSTTLSRTKSQKRYSDIRSRSGPVETGDWTNCPLAQVQITRGEEGFGFTIFCDSPVRVQSVDAGGPAGCSGLHEGDVIRQLNGLLVDCWTATDLARTIRACPSQVHLVIQRRTCDQPRPPASTDGVIVRRCQSLPRSVRCWSTALPTNYVSVPVDSLCFPTFIRARPPSMPDPWMGLSLTWMDGSILSSGPSPPVTDHPKSQTRFLE